jgi:HlyB family type I secretion system ABC transporter
MTPSMDKAQRLALLGGAGPFSLLEERTREKLAARTTLRTCAFGETVFKTGDPGDAMYVVVSGKARVVGQNAAGDEASLALLQAGEFFGITALLSDGPRNATVRAADELILLRLERAEFERAVGGNPSVIEARAALYRRDASGRAAVPVETAPPPEPVESPPEETLRTPLWRRLLRRYPFIHQHDETDCGATCMAMITATYGVPVGVARLRDMADVDADGATMWSVAQAAESLGFHARGLQLSYEALKDLHLPAIVHWEGYHYIVLYEVSDRGVLVGDPGIALFQALLGGARRFLLVHVSSHASARLVSDFLRHVLSLPMKSFDLRRVGDIISRVSENEKVRAALVGTVPGIILDTFLALGYFALMAWYNLKLTLVVAAVVPLFVLLMLAFTPAIRRNRKEHFAKHADAWCTMIEGFTGIGTVKATAIEPTVRWKMETLFVESLLVGRRGAQLEALYAAAATLLQVVSTVVFPGCGARLAMEGALTMGQLLAFTAMAGSVIGPILRLVEAWDDLQDVRNALDRLNDVFDARPEEDGSRPLLAPARLEGRIAFENVTFKYSAGQDRPTLAGVTVEIRPGETIAVVGRSGSGKSTLAKLILGLYSPTKGRVLLDGHDVRALSRRALRRRIGVVPQEVFLFSGTVRDNIALGDPDVPFDRIVRAANLAGAHDFISAMGLGYDTKVGERGMSMSGGQRQRIALARALLREPDILVLDEATSALDTESERAIQRSLEEAAKGRTSIVIAHRLSTVRGADRILVLDAGSIVEQGTHEALVEQGGLYATLVGQQVEE